MVISHEKKHSNFTDPDACPYDADYKTNSTAYKVCLLCKCCKLWCISHVDIENYAVYIEVMNEFANRIVKESIITMKT